MPVDFVVTGATSFLGGYVVRELCRSGARVCVIVRPESAARDKFHGMKNVKTVLADMGQKEQWVPEIGSASHFMHFGWDGIGNQGRADLSVQIKNVNDTLNCLEGAAALGCGTFLFAGSQAEYGPQIGVITESTPCEPVLQYGRAKLEVFRKAAPLAEAAGMKWYQARIFSLYGPGDHPWTLVSKCIQSFSAGEEIKLSHCEQKWNFLFVRDAARALAALSQSEAAGGIYNIAGRDTRRLLSFVEEIYEACGRRGSFSLGTYDPKEPIVNLQPDITKLVSAVGDLPYTSFSAGIEQTIAYFQKGEIKA